MRNTDSKEKADKIIDNLFYDEPVLIDEEDKQLIENTQPKKVESNSRLKEGKEAIERYRNLFCSRLGLPKNFLEENNICCRTIERRISNIMENYIVINGKKAELTEEQLKQLGIEVEKKRNNPFNNEIDTYEDMPYYMIDHIDIENGVVTEYSNGSDFEKTAAIRANSFNDKAFANQVYLHELLNRQLLKYAYDNEAEDCEWDGKNDHYYIYFDILTEKFAVTNSWYNRCQKVYFSKKNVALQAIKDVIKPFMKEHPEFVW